jgi:hypothetical protein
MDHLHHATRAAIGEQNIVLLFGTLIFGTMMLTSAALIVVGNLIVHTQDDIGSLTGRVGMGVAWSAKCLLVLSALAEFIVIYGRLTFHS